MIRMLIKGNYTNMKRPTDTSIYTIALDSYPYGVLSAPSMLVPTTNFDFDQVYEVLAATHERLKKELCIFSGTDPEVLESPDPDTGYWFTLGGWVRLQALHEAHHLQKINELIAARQ